MALLLSDYSLQLISNQILRFFQVNNAEPILKQSDEQVYQRLHEHLLHHPTRRETKLNNSKQNPVQDPLVLQERTWDRTLMYRKYTFRSGSIAKFSREFDKWWQKYYQYAGSSVNNVKVRLLPETNRALESFLIHKKPPREFLTEMEQPNN